MIILFVMNIHYIPNKGGWINEIIRYIQEVYCSNNEISIEERIALSNFARKELKRMGKDKNQERNIIANEIIRKFNSLYNCQFLLF